MANGPLELACQMDLYVKDHFINNDQEHILNGDIKFLLRYS